MNQEQRNKLEEYCRQDVLNTIALQKILWKKPTRWERIVCFFGRVLARVSSLIKR